MNNYVPVSFVGQLRGIPRQIYPSTEIEKQEELINKIKNDLTEVKQILTSIIDKNASKDHK